MDYNKLWSLINKEGISKRGAAKIVNMSPTGFISMMERKTMSVETLELFAKHFNVPILHFFENGESEIELSPTGTCGYCMEKDIEIKILNKHLLEKDSKIESLQKKIGELEYKLRGNNEDDNHIACTG